eukprot:scaffold94181_cov59-Phaeocystis_antarctica.AAC.7
MSKTRLLSLWPAGSPEVCSSGARSCTRLPRAPASLGQPASRAALAGHIGPTFDLGVAAQAARHRLRGGGGRAGRGGRLPRGGVQR